MEVEVLKVSHKLLSKGRMASYITGPVSEENVEKIDFDPYEKLEQREKTDLDLRK